MRLLLFFLILVPPLLAERILLPKIVYSNPETQKVAGALTLQSPWVTAPLLHVRRKGFESKVKLKSLIYEGTIYFKIQWMDNTPDTFHKPWKWDGNKRIYIVGPQREDSLVFRWEISASSDNRNSKNDLWYWGAERTKDYADDMSEIISENYFEPSQVSKDFFGREYYRQVIGDSGVRCYKTEFKAPISLRPSRYEPQEPKGSRGDVHAQARWENGEWTLEFKRKMVTGNLDDIEFKHNQDYSFDISGSFKNAHIVSNQGAFQANKVFPLQMRNAIENEEVDFYTFSPDLAKSVRQDILKNIRNQFPAQMKDEDLPEPKELLFEFSQEVAESIRRKNYTASHYFRFENIGENFPLKMKIPPEFHQLILE